MARVVITRRQGVIQAPEGGEGKMSVRKESTQDHGKWTEGKSMGCPRIGSGVKPVGGGLKDAHERVN